jgi:DNA replicative helicase MCM subunit Mcm2 (Cdc46/Mcm family)
VTFYEFFASNESARSHLHWEKKEDNFEQIVVHINHAMLSLQGTPAIREFLTYVTDHPSDIVGAIAIALDSLRMYVLGQSHDQRTVVARFYNYNQMTPLSQIKSHMINKFLCLRGTVLRVSSIKVLVERITFKCHDCKLDIDIAFIDGKWETPNRCISADCRSRIFNPEKHTAKTAFF